MAKEFEELARKREPEKKEPNVNGNFQCFWCKEHVKEAHHDPNSKVLEWHCKNGHRSFIEDFEL